MSATNDNDVTTTLAAGGKFVAGVVAREAYKCLSLATMLVPPLIIAYFAAKPLGQLFGTIGLRFLAGKKEAEEKQFAADLKAKNARASLDNSSTPQ